MMKIFALVICSLALASAMFPFRRMNPMMGGRMGGMGGRMGGMGGRMGGMRRYDMDYPMGRMDRRDFRGMDDRFGGYQGMGGMGMRGMGGMGGMFVPEMEINSFDRPSFDQPEVLVINQGGRRGMY